MKYVGSKRRIAKEIIPILIKDRKPNQYFVEPFCGSCSIIEKIDNPRIAADNHYYLIEMWKWLQKGWLPPKNVTEEEYNHIKRGILSGWVYYCYPYGFMAHIGFIGFCCSFSGKWFGGYARGNNNKGKPRNYAYEQYKNILKDIPLIQGIDFRCCDYRDLDIPPNSIIYCDIPYKKTTKYKTSTQFDYDEFYKWCREKHGDGHEIFVSEYEMPPDFRCVWQKEIYSSLDLKGGKRGIERLFTL